MQLCSKSLVQYFKDELQMNAHTSGEDRKKNNFFKYFFLADA